MTAGGTDKSQEIVLRKQRQGWRREGLFQPGKAAQTRGRQICPGNRWRKRHSGHHPGRPPASRDTESRTRPRGRRIPAVGRGQKARPRTVCPPPGPQGQARSCKHDRRLPAWTQPPPRALIHPLSRQGHRAARPNELPSQPPLPLESPQPPPSPRPAPTKNSPGANTPAPQSHSTSTMMLP